MVYEAYRASKKKTLLSRHDRWRATAKVLFLSKEACKRLEWFIYFETRGERSVVLTARYFGIGRSTFHKWQKLFGETNLRTLENKSCAPKKKRERQAIASKDERVILLRRRYPYWGKMKLQKVYKREYGEEIISWYIQCVIEHYNSIRRKERNRLK